MSRKRSTGMPTMEFGSDPKKRLTLASGTRGKVQLAGTAVFTRDGFRHFLRQASWYLDQLELQSEPAGPPDPPDEGERPRPRPIVTPAAGTCPRCGGCAERELVEGDSVLLQNRCINCGNRF